MLGFIILLIIASICGSIGARIAGYSSTGCLTSIILGFIGALIGTYLSRELGIKDFIYFHNIPIFWSIIGSAIFIAIIGFLSGHKKQK